MQKTILLGTRKGFIAYQFSRDKWKVENLSFEGVPVSIAYADPRNGTWWACLDHGHWGVKLHRSVDRGIHGKKLLLLPILKVKKSKMEFRQLQDISGRWRMGVKNFLQVFGWALIPGVCF